MQYPPPLSSADPPPVVQDTREMNVMFVHSEIDDLGLTAAQFRIYAHLCRRASSGQAYPGIDSMAKTCLLSKPTIIASIRHLEALGMIEIKKHEGRTNQYFITAKSRWKPLPKIYRSNLDTGKKEVTHQSKIGNATGKKEVTKGNPYKVIHIRNKSTPHFRKDRGTLEEFKEFSKTIELPESDGEYLFYHFESNGWMRGKNKIKDWRATFRNWKSSGWLPSQKNQPNQPNGTHQQAPNNRIKNYLGTNATTVNDY